MQWGEKKGKDRIPICPRRMSSSLFVTMDSSQIAEHANPRIYEFFPVCCTDGPSGAHTQSVGRLSLRCPDLKKKKKKRVLLMISLETQHHQACTFARDGLRAVWGGALRLTVCSLAARWGLCTFILMDALRFSSSLLRDAGGHAEPLDSSPAAGRVSRTGSRTFQSTRCLLRFLVKTGGGVWKPRRNTVGGLYFSADWKTNDDL